MPGDKLSLAQQKFSIKSQPLNRRNSKTKWRHAVDCHCWLKPLNSAPLK